MPLRVRQRGNGFCRESQSSRRDQARSWPSCCRTSPRKRSTRSPIADCGMPILECGMRNEIQRTKPLRGGKDPGLVHKPSASATRPIDSDFAPCLYQRAAPCYSSAWLRLAAASVQFFTLRSPGTLPRTRPLPIYSIYIKAKAVPVAASSSEIASARPTGPEFRPRSFTALRIQHSSKDAPVLTAVGAPDRSPDRDGQATCVVCAAATLDDPATRIENQLVKSKWAC